MQSVIDNLCAQGKALGDINGDGYPDVIIAEGEFSPGAFAWYRYPNWEKYDIHPTSFSEMDYVPDCQAADMDGDGDVDIVVPNSVNSGDKCLWWFENPLNNGGDPETDYFSRHVVWSGSDDHIKDVSIADFDKDGKQDIVIRHTSKVAVFFQNSADSWTQVNWAVSGSEGMGVGDMDRDGDTDVVTNGVWYQNPGNRVDVWTGRTIDSYSQSNDCRMMAADINGDGHEEPVFSASEHAGHAVSWYSASDPVNGPWTEHVIGYIDYCHTLQVGDVDRDGDIDVVGGSMPAAATDEVVLFENTGSGASWTRHTVDSKSTYIAKMADMGADGDLDIVGSRSFNVAPIDFYENQLDPVLPLNQWQYIQADDSRGAQAFGLALSDITDDDYLDIASGPYFYRNPGGSMTGTWIRTDLPGSMDAVLMTDVDDDAYGDIIAQKDIDSALRFYWLEAGDGQGVSWAQIAEIGSVPQASHSLGSQGHCLVQVESGGKPEIVVTSGNGIYYFRIPGSPSAGSWPVVHVNSNPTDEGIGFADIDGDGDVDLACGTGDTKRVEWYENPGDGSGSWAAYHIGDMTESVWTDRFEITDLNGDDKPDIVGTEENGADSGADSYWWEQPADPKSSGWTRHLIVSQATTNSMDIEDMDQDGDTDVILAEHRGTEKLAIWSNDGTGVLTEYVIDTGKESHLGAQCADLDNDGDTDIVSIAWDNYACLHIWRNDAIPSPVLTVAAPTISPDGGTHIGSVVVTLITSTPGAILYYTVNGEDPDESDTAYSDPFTITQSLTVKVRGYCTGMEPSSIASADFTIEEDNTGPEITSVSATGSNTRVQIDFNEDIDEATAETAANYTVDNGVTVVSATLSTDCRNVVLETSFLSSGITYTLTVNNVEDQSGNPIISDTEATFQFIPVLLSDGLTAYYPLDEKSGMDVEDGSGHENDGTLYGGQWTTGHIEGAVQLDGADDYIDLGGLDIEGSGLSIACWFQADDFDNDDGRLVSKATGTAEADHWWMLSTTSSGGQYRLRFRLKTGTTTSTLVASSGSLSPGTWYHAAAVYDGSNMKLYLNGAEVGSTGKTGDPAVNAGVNAWIGSNPPSEGSNVFDGLIDEVRLYSRALNPEEIFSLSTSPVLVSVKIFLSGAYQSTPGGMRTILRDNGYIPLTSPYLQDIRTTTEVPVTVTDWILVQLRETASGEVVASRSAFLRNDGFIIPDDGTDGPVPLNSGQGNYYIVIRHRNHLDVMSGTTQFCQQGDYVLYDFTENLDMFYQSNARVLESGVYGMFAGDANGTEITNSGDYLVVKTNNGSEGYYMEDCNMTGVVNSADYLVIKSNSGEISSVP